MTTVYQVLHDISRQRNKKEVIIVAANIFRKMFQLVTYSWIIKLKKKEKKEIKWSSKGLRENGLPNKRTSRVSLQNEFQSHEPEMSQQVAKRLYNEKVQPTTLLPKQVHRFELNKVLLLRMRVDTTVKTSVGLCELSA
ncbi:hypothetical protein Scep_023673 [Stephania cephalantha]|uniref:Uncharacterized protein n=1 Tax=Stephania cephalantha TaxID=152367 RepID=A0AAP0HT04_9MAGN